MSWSHVPFHRCSLKYLILISQVLFILKSLYSFSNHKSFHRSIKSFFIHLLDKVVLGPRQLCFLSGNYQTSPYSLLIEAKLLYEAWTHLLKVQHLAAFFGFCRQSRGRTFMPTRNKGHIYEWVVSISSQIRHLECKTILSGQSSHTDHSDESLKNLGERKQGEWQEEVGRRANLIV